MKIIDRFPQENLESTKNLRTRPTNLVWITSLERLVEQDLANPANMLEAKKLTIKSSNSIQNQFC